MRVCIVGANHNLETLRALVASRPEAEWVLLGDAQELARPRPESVGARSLEELLRAADEPVLETAGLPRRAGELAVALRALVAREPLDEIRFPARGALAWHAIHDARTGGALRASRLLVELRDGDEALAAPLGERCELAAIQLRDATRFCLQQADEVAGDPRCHAELSARGWRLGSPRPRGSVRESGSRERLAVVMPHLDSIWIGETLASLRAQTHPIAEIIIVDDRSSDAGFARVQDEAARDPRIQLHRLRENIGAARARNLGAELARSELLWFVDADNLMRPRMAERLAQALRCDPEAAWAQSGLRAFHQETGETVFIATPHPPEFSITPLILSNAGGDVCAIHRRERFLAAGGFVPERRAPEDWLLWQRYAARGEHGVLVPEVLFDYRLRPNARWVKATGMDWLRFATLGALHNPSLLAQGGEELALVAARHFGGQLEQTHTGLAESRTESAQLRDQLAKAQAELARANTALAAAGARLESAEHESRLLHEALAEMSGSSAVQVARAFKGASPQLHAALGTARRTAAGWLRLARKLRQSTSGAGTS